MDALKVLESSLEAAQAELAEAEIALTEANFRAQLAREAQGKLAAAVAALSGEPPPTTNTQTGYARTQIGEATEPLIVNPDENSPQNLPNTSIPTNISPERQAIHDMTPEEFDAHRKREQRRKKKEEQANNPYAHIKCSGCGTKGSMAETIMQAPSGAPVRMMVCNSCGNQIIT